MTNLKSQMYSNCERYLDIRLKSIEKSIYDIQNAIAFETKSSAGDKHETSRAMLQLEREKLGQQLLEVQKLFKVLEKIDCNQIQERAALGSLVYTTNQNYYIAISAGEYYIDGESFYAVSAATPIAKVLLGKQKGDIISFRSSTFVIRKIS